MIRVSAIPSEASEQQDAPDEGALKASRRKDLKDNASSSHNAPVMSVSKPRMSSPGIKIHNSRGLRSLKIINDHDEPTDRSEKADVISMPESAPAPDLKLAPENAPVFSGRDQQVQFFNRTAALVTGLWFGICAFVLMSGSLGAFSEMTIQGIGGYLSTILTPPALFWLMLSNWQRQADVDYYTELLRSELQQILNPARHHAADINNDIERLSRQAEELSASSSAVMRSLNKTRQDLRVEIQNFLGMTKNTEFHIERLTSNLKERATELLKITEDVEERTDAIAFKANEGVKAWNETGDKFADHADRMEQLFKAKLNPEAFLKQLEESSSVIDGKVGSVKEIMEQLRSCSDELEQRTSNFEAVTREAAQKIEIVEHRLKEQGLNIHILSDQAVLRAESVEQAVGKQFESLKAHVDQAIAALQEACKQFETTTHNTGEAANSAIEKITDASTHSELQSERLIKAAQQTAIKTQEMVSYLKGQTGDLMSSTGEALNVLQKTGHTLSVRTREITSQLDHILDASSSYTEKMKEQARELEQTSLRSVAGISEAGNVLSTRLEALKDTAGATTLELQRSGDKIQAEAGRFITTSKEALGSAKVATSEYAAHSDRLLKTISSAEQKVGEIKIKSLKVQDEGFMNAARFIIESLYSLSVDLTRGLDGEISEKMWKSFNKGDLSVFTRRLSALGGSAPLEKIAEKYKKDGEFRTYVQRYKNQFEEIFMQAMQQDHKRVLATSVASSDVAKLYELLCEATGGGSKISEKKGSGVV